MTAAVMRSGSPGEGDVHRRRAGAIVVATVALILAVASPAWAREPVTYGDVRAQFEAVGTGGAVIFTNKGFETAIPPASPFLHSIRPIKSFFDGRRYCELDWHLVTITLGGSAEAFAVSTTQEARAIIENTQVTFKIDNVPVPAQESTAVKTFLNSLLGGVPGESFWRAWGNFYAPAVLPVGSHSLSGSVTSPIGSFRLDRITFHIDPAGQGACL